jgi:hypothetical protein
LLSAGSERAALSGTTAENVAAPYAFCASITLRTAGRSAIRLK